MGLQIHFSTTNPRCSPGFHWLQLCWKGRTEEQGKKNRIPQILARTASLTQHLFYEFSETDFVNLKFWGMKLNRCLLVAVLSPLGKQIRFSERTHTVWESSLSESRGPSRKLDCARLKVPGYVCIFREFCKKNVEGGSRGASTCPSFLFWSNYCIFGFWYTENT